VLSCLMFLLWPLAHSAIKHFQHSNLVFGDRTAEYTASTSGFFKAYGKAVATGFAGIVVALLIALGLTYGVSNLSMSGLGGVIKGSFVAGITVLLSAYVVYLLARPYLQVCVGNYVWNHTSFPGVSFRSSMGARRYIGLQTRNLILTVLTLGLYRPFAVVNTYAFRLEHAEVVTESSFDHVIANFASGRGNASGDGAADMFGFDLSW